MGCADATMTAAVTDAACLWAGDSAPGWLAAGPPGWIVGGLITAATCIGAGYFTAEAVDQCTSGPAQQPTTEVDDGVDAVSGDDDSWDDSSLDLY